MDILDVSGLYKFDKAFPFFAKPEEVDSFSINNERRVIDDKSQSKQFSAVVSRDSERVHFDLNKDYANFENNKYEDEYLDCLLQWILLYKKRCDQTAQLRTALFNTNFVCWRGLLTKIACTPYEKREAWIVCVTKYKDVYFLCEFETEEKKKQKTQMTEKEKLMTYWGHCFESYVTKPSSGETCTTPSWVNTSEQFCSVVRTKLGSYRLLFGGEVDCSASGSDDEYLELKTSRYMETDRQRTNFRRFKLLKWWLQSFLIGINRIVCGFRDDNGIVVNLEEFKTDQIPDMGKNYWSGAICFNFLHEFLHAVETNVVENDLNKVYRFEYSPVKQKVSFEETDPVSFNFLRPWFVKEM